jgi:hypothetical protein
MDVYIHIFLTSALVGGELSAARPSRFTPGIHWIGGWVGLRAGVDGVKYRKFLTLPGLELQPPGRPAHRTLHFVQNISDGTACYV